MIRQNKTLLFAGGSHSDIPMICAAKKLGFHVITSGNNPNETGHHYSDDYAPCDYSDSAAICLLARDLKVDAVCPSCNDFSLISCTHTAQTLGLPGRYDKALAVQTIHHKDKYRQFALENGIDSPLACTINGPDNFQIQQFENWRFPLIVKPVDLSGGKGICKVEQPDKLKPAIDNAFNRSKAGRVVVEEFLEGSRHGFSAFLIGGKIVFSFMDDEYYFKNPYLVSGASSPSSAGKEARTKLIADSQTIATKLELCDGIFHVQFIMHKQSPVIIEITRRPPGDLYVKLVEYACNIPYPEWLVRAYTGLELNCINKGRKQGSWLRHCIMASKNGRLEKLDIDPAIKNKIKEIVVLGKLGDTIADMMIYKYGIAFIEFDDKSEMDTLCKQMPQLIKPDVTTP